MDVGMAPEEELRPISTTELALFVGIFRKNLGRSQETLAELTGLTVRTIQRVENSEPSSVDTRRALARAFQIEDMDVFNKPHMFSSAEKIMREVEQAERNFVTLDARVATSGKQLADLAEEMTMHCFQQPDGASAEFAEDVAHLFDYVRDYGEVSDEYSYSEKLGAHKAIDEYLERVKSAGFSVCYARRATKIVGKDWVDKTPWPVVMAYLFVTKKGEEPKRAVVPKALNVGF
jgi:transcriptional regulator with XRE-family HTH domain